MSRRLARHDDIALEQAVRHADGDIAERYSTRRQRFAAIGIGDVVSLRG